jgi:hypothetical protein
VFALLVDVVSNSAPVDLQQPADFLERGTVLFDIYLPNNIALTGLHESGRIFTDVQAT